MKAVAFVATIPVNFTDSTTSIISSACAKFMSGAIFTKTGLRLIPAPAASLRFFSCTAETNSRRRLFSWRSRRFGVFGELTFNVKKSPWSKSFSKQERKSATASFVSTILVRPMLTPRGICGLPRRMCRRSSLSAIASAPSLLEPRFRIAGLRLCRYGTDFHETKAKARNRLRCLGVLIEAGGQSHRVGKCQRPDPNGQTFVFNLVEIFDNTAKKLCPRQQG